MFNKYFSLSKFRLTLATISLIFSIGMVFAQDEIPSGKALEIKQLFSTSNDVFSYENLRAGTLLELDLTQLAQIVDRKPTIIHLSIPFNGVNIQLELAKKQIVSLDFSLQTSAPTEENFSLDDAVFYQGKIVGDNESLVALSFFQDFMMGVISSKNMIGTLNLSKLKNEETKYVLFSDAEVQMDVPFSCDYINPNEKAINTQVSGNPELECQQRAVNVFLESTFDMYQLNQNSVVNTAFYLLGLFNSAKAMYAAEQIDTDVSGMFIWNTQDTYSTTSSLDALVSFRTDRTTFNGDIAHLVSNTFPGLGGIAYLDVLCVPMFNYAYSNITASNATVLPFPIYSWAINVFVHEMGHNLGTPHTHDCVWEVNGILGLPIDECGPVAGFPSSSCSPIIGSPVLPPFGTGTVMSYCHLNPTGVGVNLAIGFGPQPGDLIRDNTYNSTCLSVANNECINAKVLIPDSTCNYKTFSTNCATQSQPASNCNGQNNGNADDDIWFKFEAATGITYTINVLNGTNFDGVVDLRKDSCSSAILSCANAPGSTGVLNTITYTATSNTTLFLRVYHYGLGSGGGSFQICVQKSNATTAPCNNVVNINSCGSAASQTFSATGLGNWFSSTQNACNQTTAGNERIYSYVAERSGTYRIQVTSASGQAYYFYKEGACNEVGWNCIGFAGSSNTIGNFYMVAGTKYYFLVDATSASTTTSHTFHLVCPCVIPGRPTLLLGPDTACIGSPSVYFTPRDTFATNYTWTVPIGWIGTSTTDSIILTPTASALSGVLRVVAENTCGISQGRNRTIAVGPASPTPSSISGPSTACIGGQYTFSVIPNPNIQSFVWTVPTGWSIINNLNSQIIVSVGGNLGIQTLSVSASTSCGLSTPTTTNIIVNVNTITVVQNGNQLQAQQTGNSYQWINCVNNAPISGATSAIFAPPASGDYAVIVTQGGCVDTSACFNFTSVSTANLELANGFSLFPNPFLEQSNIFHPDAPIGNYILKVLDAQGRLIKNVTINHSGGAFNNSISLQGFADGMYFLELSIQNQSTRMKLLKISGR